MVDAGVSFGVGLLIGGLGLMLGWGLLWLVSSTAIAGGAMAGVLWVVDSARLTSSSLHAGLAGVPLALLVAGFCRLEDGRRIGPAFLEGSRLMLHQLLGVHEEGCGHCHEKPVEEPPCHQKPCYEQSCHEKPCEGKP